MATRGGKQADRVFLDGLGEVTECSGSYVGTDIPELGGFMRPGRREFTLSQLEHLPQLLYLMTSSFKHPQLIIDAVYHGLRKSHQLTRNLGN